MPRFTAVTAEADPEAVARVRDDNAFGRRRAHPYGEFARVYYPVVQAGAARDHTFLICDAAGPALLAECSSRDGIVSHFGFPLRLCPRADLEDSAIRAAAAFALKHVGELAVGQGGSEALVSGGAPTGRLGPVDEACLNHGGRPRLAVRAEADLTADADALRRDLRDSYRSLINWGRKNLRPVFVNADNPNRSMASAFGEFHARTAGRVVHRDETWMTVFDRVFAGGGEVVLGYLETGELVSAAVIVDEDDTATYFAAVYDRDRFDKPLAHWPLFEAMLRAKARGRRFFDLGEVHPRGAVSDKEHAIGFFKKGFTSRLVTETVWAVPLGPR